MKTNRKKTIKSKNRLSFKRFFSNMIVKQILLLIVLTVLFLNANYYNNSVIQQKLQTVTLPTRAIGLPTRLIIPKIKVDTNVQQVGITLQNSMDVPSNSTSVGWFKLGAKPGEKGSTVIDGHVDSEIGGKGIFSDLHLLSKGDKLYVKNDKGESFTYVVQDTKVYDEGTRVPDIFSKNDNKYLNLITCDGIWNGENQSYTQRLVVFAVAAK